MTMEFRIHLPSVFWFPCTLRSIWPARPPPPPPHYAIPPPDKYSKGYLLCRPAGAHVRKLNFYLRYGLFNKVSFTDSFYKTNSWICVILWPHISLSQSFRGGGGKGKSLGRFFIAIGLLWFKSFQFYGALEHLGRYILLPRCPPLSEAKSWDYL